MKKGLSLTAQALDAPEAVATFNATDTRLVLAKLLVATMAAMEKWVRDEETDQVARLIRQGDRLLGTDEICERLHFSMSKLMRGWKAGRYPFMLKDGGLLYASEDALERWIKARIKR